jgi:hypothetical protein
MSLSQYFFKPKPHGEPYKLVLVLAEADKAIGSASSLAKTLKFKDLRAADDALVSDVLGKSKADATLQDLTPNNAAAVFVVLSATAPEVASIKAQLDGAQMKYSEITFGEKGAAA